LQFKWHRAQYSQYGIYDIPDEQLESFAKRILEKPEENERIYKRLYEDKVIQSVKEKVTLRGNFSKPGRI
jgi:trigger factor